MCGRWFGLAALNLGALVWLVNRIYVEEDSLLEELGVRYRCYAEGHKRLVPFVWY